MAVKVLRPGLMSRHVYRRFANEAEILGRLRHPAIAQVYSSGAFTLLDTQVPYFVMEYVPNSLPITRFARDRTLSLADFFTEPGGFGRGAAVIEVSSDGTARHVVCNGLEPRLWGAGWEVDEPLPQEICGTSVLWVRVRLLAEDAPNVAYTTAQFGRTVATAEKPVFAVTAGSALASP